jgi:hypothetical protein
MSIAESVSTGLGKYAHAQNRVADGFHWADSLAGLYGKSDSLFQKASFTSSDAGINNQAFGEVLWQQANTKTPLWGMLPKVPSDSPVNSISDPRPQTFRRVFNPPAHSSTSEGSGWSSPVTFDVRETSADPHEGEMLFEATVLQQLQAEIQDGVPFENLTQIGEEYFQLSLEANGVAAANESSGGTGTQYSNLTDIVPLDKVVSSADEEANADDTTGTAYVDGDTDVYGIDRSATADGGANEANHFDAVVDHNSAGGDRQLTKDLINGMIESLETNGTDLNNLVIYTGTDTARVMSELRESQFRADMMAQAVAQSLGRGTDEAEARQGVETNARISHWDGIPVVQGQNVASDSLSRIYFLDMTSMTDPVTGQQVPKLGVEVYLPMVTETAGLGQATNTLAIDKKADQVGVLTYHELVCRRANHQGKLRDLAE